MSAIKQTLSETKQALDEAKYWAIVPAAGSGRRFGASKPKQYQTLLNKPVAQWTLERLLAVKAIAGCVVAIDSEDNYWAESGITNPLIQLTYGGAERVDTVRLALQALAGQARPDDWVLVHDIARPCVPVADIERLQAELANHPVGGILATPVADTVKRVDQKQTIQGTEDRSGLWHALTPQMFRYAVLQQALEQAAANGFLPTDEASAVEALGYQPKVVAGQRDNIKITRREDLAIAEAILQAQAGQAGDAL